MLAAGMAYLRPELTQHVAAGVRSEDQSGGQKSTGNGVQSRRLPESRNKSGAEYPGEMASRNENNYQLARSDLELSLVYRDEGDTTQAKQSAEEAVRIAQNTDIKNVAINGLIDLGLAFMSNGSFDDAGNYFQQAFDLAQRANSEIGKMRAHLSLGRLDLQKSDNDKAIPELEQALNFYKPRGYHRETSLALTLLGRVYQDKGEDAVALKYFNEQFQVVTEANDQLGLGDSHMSLALLQGVNEERYTEALSHLDEKLKMDEGRSNSNRGLAFDQMNSGNFLWQLGRYEEAATALDAAYEIANRPETQYKAALAWVHLVRGRIALSQLKYADAKKGPQR